MLVVSFFVVVAFAVSAQAKIHAYPLPRYVERACQRNDPQFENCIVEVGNKAIKAVTKGDSKYRVPKLEPLVIPEIRIRQGTPQVGITLVCSKCSMYGLQEAKFTKAKADMEARKAEWSFYLDNLAIRGKYNISGKVLLLPISGSGDADINIKKLDFTYRFTWDLLPKGNGMDYIKVNNFSLTQNVGGLEMKFDNLFNGDKLLGENMNRFLNDNWAELVRELGPAVAEALGQVFTTVLNAMSDLIPYETLFPK